MFENRFTTLSSTSKPGLIDSTVDWQIFPLSVRFVLFDDVESHLVCLPPIFWSFLSCIIVSDKSFTVIDLKQSSHWH